MVTEYQTLIELYQIPEEFVRERDRSVTHSLGRQLSEDGRESERLFIYLAELLLHFNRHHCDTALWMHFLAGIPRMDSPNQQPEWLKWGFVLSWLPKTAQAQTTICPSSVRAIPRMTYTIMLIVFQHPVETLQQLIRCVQSPNWTDATIDPYVLVDIALSSWYHRIDKVAWEVTNLIRNEEEDIFRRARMLRSTIESTVTDLDLYRIHTSAKNAIFMIEALDAAIRLSDMALFDHETLCQRGSRVWENTHRLLRHRNELFHSTKLRTVSSQTRIKNTVDLVRYSSNPSVTGADTARLSTSIPPTIVESTSRTAGAYVSSPSSAWSSSPSPRSLQSLAHSFSVPRISTWTSTLTFG